MKPLRPGDSFSVDQVVLSDDGRRAVGRTNLVSGEGTRLWLNLRSRVNRQGLLRPTWYVIVSA